MKRSSRRGRAVLLGLTASAALIGCASFVPKGPQAMRVEPVYRVSNGGDVANGRAYLALGQAYQGEKRWPEAIDAFTKAVFHDPDNAEAHNALGIAQASLLRLEASIVAFTRAVDLSPESAQYLNNLGYALLLSGQIDRAVPFLRASLARDPSHEQALINLGRAETVRNLVADAANAPAATASTPPVSDAPVAVPTSTPATAPPMQVATPTLVAVATPVAAPAPVAVATPAATPAPVAVATPVAAQAPVAVATPVAAPTPVATSVPTQAPTTTLPTQTPIPTTTTVGSVPAAAAPSAVVGEAAASPQPASMVSLPPPAAASPEARALPASAAANDRLGGFRVEISNGNGREGAAARVREWLRERGLDGARLSNLKPFISPSTVVQYQPGYAVQAQEIARRMPDGVGVAPAAGPSARADVRVVIGHDTKTTAACQTRWPCAPAAPMADAPTPELTARLR